MVKTMDSQRNPFIGQLVLVTCAYADQVRYYAGHCISMEGVVVTISPCCHVEIESDEEITSSSAPDRARLFNTSAPSFEAMEVLDPELATMSETLKQRLGMVEKAEK
jgi:hypothetical protein